MSVSFNVSCSYPAGATIYAQCFYMGNAVGSPIEATPYPADDSEYGVSLASIQSPVDQVKWYINSVSDTNAIWNTTGLNWNGTTDITNSLLLTNIGELATQSQITSLQSTLLLAIGSTGTPSGLTAVDHNYGGTNQLQYVDPNGNPIVGGKILVFSLDSYQQATELPPPENWAVGSTTTVATGYWASKIWLDAGEYVVQFSFLPIYAPVTANIIVGDPIISSSGSDGTGAGGSWNV